MTAGPALTADHGLSRDFPVPFPVDVTLTLSVHRHGGGDPTHATDADGAVWVASVPGRGCVRVREGGEVLDVISTDRGCFACMLGGADGRTLFITARKWNCPASVGGRKGQLLDVDVPVPHAGWP